MNISSLIREKHFDTEKFYEKILNGNYPFKYRSNGIYIKNIFSFYHQEVSDNKDLVLETIKYFDYFNKTDFDFSNFDNYLIVAINTIIEGNHKRLFTFFDENFVKKNYQELYSIFDELRMIISNNRLRNRDRSLLPVTNNYFPILSLIYIENIVEIKNRCDDEVISYFLGSILKALAILYWINNNQNIKDLNVITYQLLLKEDFIDTCIFKGININNTHYDQIDYLAKQIYNNEFSDIKKKVIK